MSQEARDWVELNKSNAINYLVSLDEGDANVNAEIAQTLLFLYGRMVSETKEKS